MPFAYAPNGKFGRRFCKLCGGIIELKRNAQKQKIKECRNCYHQTVIKERRSKKRRELEETLKSLIGETSVK